VIALLQICIIALHYCNC